MSCGLDQNFIIQVAGEQTPRDVHTKLREQPYTPGQEGGERAGSSKDIRRSDPLNLYRHQALTSPQKRTPTEGILAPLVFLLAVGVWENAGKHRPPPRPLSPPVASRTVYDLRNLPGSWQGCASCQYGRGERFRVPAE